MAETVSPRDWRRRKASHTSTSSFHLPPELAEWVGEMTGTIRALQVKVQELEAAELRRRDLDSALVQGLDDFMQKRGAA